MVLILHVGGHSTTTDVIATGMYHLLANSGAYQELREDPSIVPSAVEEILGYDTAVTVATPRVAADGIEVGGTRESPPARKCTRFWPQRTAIRLTSQTPTSSTFVAPTCATCLSPRASTSASALISGVWRHRRRSICSQAHARPLELTVGTEGVECQDSFPRRGLVSLPVAWREGGSE
jgi:hypothetical protein